MADPSKEEQGRGGGSFFAELKTLFPHMKTRNSMVFAYGFMFTVIAFTGFLAFSPSSNSSSPWFNNIFSSSSSNSDYGSHFSSFFTYLFPNSSQPIVQTTPNPNNNTSQFHLNQTDTKQLHLNQTVTATSSGLKDKKVGKNETVKTGENRVVNSTTTPLKKGKIVNISSSLLHCDIFDGNWVMDNSYPLYKPGSCPHIDESFNCYLNGRPDANFQKYRWQPKGCNIPRLKGEDMLELLRGKRLVFVGDSLNRNMWESLVCTLSNSVSNKSKVYEASGSREFRTEHSYLFIFEDYNCTVEFFRSPFLVEEFEMPERNGSKKETLRLDLLEPSSAKYKNADYIVFNTGHWWTHPKTTNGKDYFQEGSHLYSELNVLEAFRKALTTWARWVDANVNPNKSLVMFRGYSSSHFKGGQWNSGGQCNAETEPIKNETYLSVYPPKMRVLEKVLKNMKTPVAYLNITRMTDYRKDAHPSVYRKLNLSEEERKDPLRFQDCSHWCLPGVPDSWNELLYAQLLIRQYQDRQRQQKLEEQQQQQKQQQKQKKP
ncbi:hypothetical protein ACHQM5_018696 [Ranunculus cassubicifolius]